MLRGGLPGVEALVMPGTATTVATWTVLYLRSLPKFRSSHQRARGTCLVGLGRSLVSTVWAVGVLSSLQDKKTLHGPRRGAAATVSHW